MTLYQWAFKHNRQQLARTSISGLVFVNLYFYIFNQHQVQARQVMNSNPAAGLYVSGKRRKTDN
jgi:hypothetical protein